MADRPELMAIGDSIYNGTRSLTTNAEMARNAVPAQVARAFGWDFNAPDYPFDVLFNLETIFRTGDFSVRRLKDAVLANVERWRDLGRWSTADAFDNLAIAQTTIADQAALTYNNNVSQIPGLVTAVRNGQGFDFLKPTVALYEALNSSFLLNPGNDATSPWADKTPLEIVALRRPRRLLVNIGVNDGIWTICLEARKDGFEPDTIATDMYDLGVRLHELKAAGQVDTIYLNLMPKPSCIANLMPRTDPSRPPGANGYFPEYLGRLGQLGGLAGADMKRLDESVVSLNQRIHDDLAGLFADTGGLAFVDTYGLVAARDDKHFRDTAPIWVSGGRMNNIPLVRLGVLGHKGGLYSLDNLHPTTVGYAALAQQVCARIEAVEGIAPAHPIDLQEAFDSDSLLRDIPRHLAVETLLINLVVAFASIGRRGTV